MDTYEVKDGKMPEEFHLKHLLNNSVKVITITCNNCMSSEDVTEDADHLHAEGNISLEVFAAEAFYGQGWRYCTLPDYEVEGVFCTSCIRDYGGTEDDSLQQPREKTNDE